MPTLAPKLPYTHPFAGGYPRLGGQPLPTDPDAIDYLNRVAAADGAAVEVGVAMAVDAFVKGCKADGIWSALKASCIMCGARTISGALVPLVGAAPTPYNFVAADYDRSGGGLKGDGSTKYLDSGLPYNAISTDDEHLAFYGTTVPATGPNNLIGGGAYSTSYTAIRKTATLSIFESQVEFANRLEIAGAMPVGLIGISRSNSSEFTYRRASSSVTESKPSATRADVSTPYAVFASNYSTLGVVGYNDSRFAFYSIGSALDLALLDNRVSTLVAAIAAAI